MVSSYFPDLFFSTFFQYDAPDCGTKLCPSSCYIFIKINLTNKAALCPLLVLVSPTPPFDIGFDVLKVDESAVTQLDFGVCTTVNIAS